MLLKDIILFAAKEFARAKIYCGHGTDNVGDEAFYLVLRSLRLPFESDLTKELTAAEGDLIKKLIKRRIDERIPVAYLLNEAWFASLPFYVDQRVMIPRSSIAELISNKFQPWFWRIKVNRILDLCTGSGCIAIACAKAFPKALVDAVDLSKDALQVARKNVIKHRLQKKVALFEGDLFAPLPSKKYDIIVSNPPYVGDEEFANLPSEYYHEPKMAFRGKGVKGLTIVDKILQQAKKYLKPDGILVVEVGNNEENLIKKYPRLPFAWPIFNNGEGGIFILTAEQLDV